MSAAVLSLIPRKRGVLSRILRGRPSTITAAVVVGLAIVLAVFAPYIAPYAPDAVNILDIHQGMSAQHLLGTDGNGRDIFSRLVYGLIPTLVGPIVVVAVATTLAVTLVLVAVWFGSWVDIAVTRLFDVLLAFPGLLIAIVASSVYGASLTVAACSLAFANIPYVGRVVRSQAQRERHRPYVQASWLQGVSGFRIATGQLLPNLSPLIISQVVVSLSYAVIDLAALSYLGLGVQPPDPDLGAMISTGQNSLLSGYPLETVCASGGILILVLSLNVLGTRLGDWADG
jgi:peptide/nickel transport system permease protein